MATPSASRRSDRTAEKKITPLNRWDPENIVTLFAAEDESAKPLKIHKDVACHYSPVFKAAFNSRFTEGETQTYKLEDVGQKTVRLLIHWMYHQELDVGKTTSQTKSLTDKMLIELWVLADKLLIPPLQNSIVQELERQRKRFKATSTSCINYVYEKTAPGSPLRRLFVSWCAWNVARSRFEDRPEHFPKEMLLDLVQLLAQRVPTSTKEALAKERDMKEFEVPLGEDEDEDDIMEDSD
ncbi:uncharacterized protein PAC_01023 [Phialocephala subalpina]|uniref:BTB domain-containing protein n=1 Tax=Phialocephala subalpina TaxID=576137 RepID=A0A1L7WEJ7_9HELO|nr:uncharacterized protein PAC_01023 [Phialocephala subalpina]